jgi:ATP-dependent DNA helicase DinG
MDLKLAQKSLNFLKTDVARAMPDYELRNPQIEMMGACSKAVEEGGTLMAEAGTGTGKTFAYLIPLILSGKKGIVSTRTINLQEQLFSKDLRFLSTLKEFDYAIAKGRGNYLCLRRLNAYRTSSEEESGEYKKLAGWASKTETGDMEDYPNRSFLWDRVYSDPDACKGKKCSYYNQCFYFKARQRWGKAQIVVANHALISINAMLSDDSKILPDADVLVIDEGHALDNALSEQIGINLSKRGFENILNKLLKLDERGNYKGLLSKSHHLFQVVESLRTEMELFWDMVKKELEHRKTIKGTFALANFSSALSSSIRSLIENIRTSTMGLFKEDEELEIKASVIKLKAYAEGLETFSEGMDGFVRWPEIEEKRIALRMSPIYPRDFIRENIVPEYNSIIVTSATLSVSGDFGFTEKILGLEVSEKLSVPSPFDLSNQIAIEIKKGINLVNGEGIEKLAGVIIDEASKKDGGVLALFTSRDVMKKTWELAAEKLRNLGLNPMIQGEMPNRAMLDIMREGNDSILFGLDSFWEGVDIKGDALKCLIITKLPFEVPTEPIAAARAEDIEKQGGNAFYEYTLPRAVLKFKQGFGRLIRSKTDTGRIVVCDERIETKRYGHSFLKSIMRLNSCMYLLLQILSL